MDTLKASKMLVDWVEQGVLEVLPGRGKRNTAYSKPARPLEPAGPAAHRLLCLTHLQRRSHPRSHGMGVDADAPAAAAGERLSLAAGAIHVALVPAGGYSDGCRDREACCARLASRIVIPQASEGGQREEQAAAWNASTLQIDYLVQR